MFLTQFKIVIKITIVTFLSSFLAGKNLNDKKLHLDIIYTIAAFIVADLITTKYEKQINKLDQKIGKKIIKGVIGPIVMLLSKALFSQTSIDRKYLLNILYVVIGIGSYNIFINENLNTIDIDQDIKDILGNITRPFIMIMVSSYLKSGVNPFNSNTIRNALFTANGFVANQILVKVTGI